MLADGEGVLPGLEALGCVPRRGCIARQPSGPCRTTLWTQWTNPLDPVDQPSGELPTQWTNPLDPVDQPSGGLPTLWANPLDPVDQPSGGLPTPCAHTKWSTGSGGSINFSANLAARPNFWSFWLVYVTVRPALPTR
jgi:hypothetical protein